MPENQNKIIMFSCELCQFSTDKQSNFRTHLTTAKHKKMLQKAGDEVDNYDISEVPPHEETARVQEPMDQDPQPDYVSKLQCNRKIDIHTI